MSLPALLGGEPVAGADTYPSWPQKGARARGAARDARLGGWWTAMASGRWGSPGVRRASRARPKACR